MEQRIKLSKVFVIICLICVTAGIAALVYGFINDPARTWANYLLSSFYFLLLGIGGTFFLTLQYVSRSGWSAGFRRVAEAVMLFVPIAGLLLAGLYFGMQYLYPWTHEDLVSAHELIKHKTPYLNVPFFFIRLVVFFAIWTFLIYLIRKSSLKEDETGGTGQFGKMETYSRVFIFFLAISMSLLGFDLIMSLDPEWFSTIFALKFFIAAFQHGTALLFIIILILNVRGYLNFLNVSHIHDFARYIFIVSIFYGYFWFSQFMLIWYSNIPEETIYYSVRWNPEWKTFWVLDIILNWVVPFFVLLPVFTSRNKWIVFLVALIVLCGQWIDLFISIFPPVTGKSNIGFLEAGIFLGFAGVFALATGYHLSRASLVPLNHPLIEESYHHQFESYI